MKFSKFKKGLKNEYENSFKEEITIEKKKNVSIFIKLIPVYVISFVVVLFTLIFTIDAVYVNKYNESISKKRDELLVNNADWEAKEMTKFSSKEEYKNVMNILRATTKESIWSSIFGGSKASGSIVVDDISWAAGATGAPVAEGVDSSSINKGDSMIASNLQVAGVDEADIAKCDGTYIYLLSYEGKLLVYDLEGKVIVSKETFIYGGELYITEDSIICLSSLGIKVFSFKDQLLTEVYNKNDVNVIDSRLTNDYLYFVYSIRDYYGSLDNKINNWDCVYYDGLSNINTCYGIVRISLTDFAIKEIDEISGYSAQIFMTKDYIVLSSSMSQQYSVLSLFDMDLNSLGIFKCQGTVLNQYSIDIKDNQLRVVTSKSRWNGEAGKLNAITIFDIKELKKIGFLNEGIGLDFMTVKSVNFDGDMVYICTYETKDPLYQIDISNPEDIKIISELKAPGYSSYLYSWEYKDTTYLFGVGYTDMNDFKISLYQKTSTGTVQIGKDFIISNINHIEADYYIENIRYDMFNSPKGFFIFNKENKLYLGFNTGENLYTMLMIDLGDGESFTDESQYISVYKEYTTDGNTRCFLIDGTFYIPTLEKLIID